MTYKYYAHVEEQTNQPVGPRARHYGTSLYGYTNLRLARRYKPEGALIERRWSDGYNDWHGGIVGQDDAA